MLTDPADFSFQERKRISIFRKRVRILMNTNKPLIYLCNGVWVCVLKGNVAGKGDSPISAYIEMRRQIETKG